MGLNRNINDDSTLAYLFNKTRQGASDALEKAVEALKSLFVKKTGDTMTGTLTLNGAGVVEKNTAYAIGDAPGSQNAVSMIWTDKNNSQIGFLGAGWEADGKLFMQIGTNRTVSGTAKWHHVRQSIASDGTATVSFGQAAAWRTGMGAVYKGGDTMTGGLVIKLAGNPTLYGDNTAADITAASQAATRYWLWGHRDVGNRLASYWQTYQSTDGSVHADFVARRYTSSSAYVDNGIHFHITKAGARTVTVNEAAPWRTALGLGGMATVASPAPIANGGTGQTGVSYVSTASSIITAGSGNVIDSAYYIQWGKVAQIWVNWHRTSQINVTAFGGLTAFTVGTIVSGKRPYMSIACNDNGVAGMFFQIDSNGTVTCKSAAPGGVTSYKINANTVLNFSCTYILA